MIKIEYTNGEVETLHNAILENDIDDDKNEYVISTNDGTLHVPFNIVKNLLEVE